MQRIRDDLASGEIGPGEIIKQTVLAKRYGVSPTPVREALRVLQADGLISYSPHKGASVRELRPEAAQDLYRLRSGAEKAATEMAVERMTPEGLEAIEARFSELDSLMRDAGATASAVSVANKAFHFAIYQQASSLIVHYLELLWSRFTPSSTVFLDREVAWDLHEQHIELIEAVRRNDAEAAGEITRLHILSASGHREQMPEVRASGDEDSAVPASS